MKADCHIHMVLDAQNWKNAIARHRQSPDLPYIRQVLQQYQRLGYSYLRDGGDRWGVGKAAREMASQMGICYRTPLAPLCKKGCYGSFIGEAYETMADYAACVRSARRNGADFIKIMISGLMDFDRFGVLTQESLSAPEICELIHIAHEEGFAVMAHCNGADAALAAACAGVDSIEHGAYLNEDALAAMAENRVVWVPTVSAVANLRGKGRFDEDAVRRIFDSTAENIACFAAMQGLLAVGSDAGAWAVPHGCETEEMLLTAIAGKDALRAGTASLAERF